MSWQKALFVTIYLALSGFFLVGCGTPAATPAVLVVAPTRGTQPTPFPDVPIFVPPTDALVPPTDTLVPPTDTLVPPTDTLAPPTDIFVPPTDTLVPPTNTSVPPTATETPIVSTPTNTPEPRKPVVILMDRYPTFVDQNANILASLPIETIKEVTNPNWNRANEVLAHDPDLIVIHWSALYDPEKPQQDFYKKMDEFMEYMKNARAEFLYYTSVEDAEPMKNELEGRYHLGTRLHVLADAAHPGWDGSLRDKVREILGLN